MNEPPPDPSPTPESDRKRDTLRAMLVEAEDLHDRVETAKFRIYATLGAAFVAVFFACSYILLFSTIASPQKVLYCLGAFVPVAVVAWLIVGRVLGVVHRDQEAYHKIVSIVRETVYLIAKQEGWSRLELTDVEIRLSRLDIGPEYSERPSLRSRPS